VFCLISLKQQSLVPLKTETVCFSNEYSKVLLVVVVLLRKLHKQHFYAAGLHARALKTNTDDGLLHQRTTTTRRSCNYLKHAELGSN
jgi:hypothetical protein